MPRFQYEPLHGNEIRLLTIHPGEDGPVRLSLETVTLKPPMQIPAYEGLSYAWGDPKKTKKLVLESIPPQLLSIGSMRLRSGKYTGIKFTISVTKNLAALLPFIRQPTKPRKFWIDAICVNQRDLGERSHQVQRMGDIFRHATQVIAWVGLPSKDSLQAINLLKYVASRVMPDPISDSGVLAASEEDSSWADEDVPLPWSFSEWQSVRDYIARPWFRRLWVWQEVHLARNAILLCGRDSIAWEALSLALRCYEIKLYATIRHLETANEVGDVDAGYVAVRMALKSRDHTLFRILTLTDRCECLDPRDRLFALTELDQSIDGERSRAIIGVPDYKLDECQLSTGFTIRWVEIHQDFRLLNFISSSDLPPGWPSWVPKLPLTEARIMPPRCRTLSRTKCLGGGVLEVTGVQATTIKSIYTIDKWYRTLEEMNYEVRQIAAHAGITINCHDYDTKLRDLCITLLGGYHEEDYYPGNKDELNLNIGTMLLHSILSESRITAEQEIYMDHYLVQMLNDYYPRSLITTEDGKLGIVLNEARPGDCVCPLLGGITAVLRPRDEKYTWIGASYIRGLHNGESILGPLPPEWSAVFRSIAAESAYSWRKESTQEWKHEDPRLDSIPLPQGWRRRSGDTEDLRTFFEHEDGEATDADPRLLEEELRKRGVPLREFLIV